MRYLEDLAHVTAFLTRLPVPARAFGGAALDFSRQCWAFPLAGGAVGLLGASAGAIAFAATASPLLAGVIAVTGWVILTGALHEDGLADCADGFWGAHEVSRRMAIMRDSAIGSYGTLALIAVLALKVSAAAELIARSTWPASLLLFAAAFAFGRAALVWQWVLLFPAACDAEGPKGQSLATRFGVPGQGQAVAASVICALILLPGASTAPVLSIICAALLGSVAALGSSWVAKRKIGGYSGDTLGATALLTEAAFLCGLLVTTSTA